MYEIKKILQEKAFFKEIEYLREERNFIDIVGYIEKKFTGE